MKYPMLNNWLTFKRINPYEYSVRDGLLEYEFTMGCDIADFARKLDGDHNPYYVDKRFSRAEVDQMMNALEDNDLLRYSKTLISEFGSIYRTLWIPRFNKTSRAIAVIWNIVLNLLWLPVFILGIIAYTKKLPIGGSDYMLLGVILGLISGIVLHEFGHMCSGIYHGAKVFEMGVMISSFLPGAYVLLDSSNLKSKMAKIRISSAGVKSNLLLSGVFLLLACLFPSVGSPLLGAAINNAFLAFINITLIKGLDGAAIISDLLGIDDIVSKSKEILHSKKARRRLSKKGLNGYAVMAIAVAVRATQIALPLLYIINGLEILSCFM